MSTRLASDTYSSIGHSPPGSGQPRCRAALLPAQAERSGPLNVLLANPAVGAIAVGASGPFAVPGLLGLKVLQVFQEAEVRWRPAERLLGVGAGGWLVGREDGTEGAVGLLCHRLDRESEPASDGRGDVPHRVTLVGHGVPGRPGRRLLQGQPEQDRSVKGVHGWPSLGAVAGVTRHPGAARDVGQQASEPALALVVDRARHAHGGGADPA